MICPYINCDVNCNCSCYGCSYNPQSNPNGITYNYSLQFNYECPDCHGKFRIAVVEATVETKIMNIKEIGNPSLIAQQIIPILKYKCPFCGRIMEGLK